MTHSNDDPLSFSSLARSASRGAETGRAVTQSTVAGTRVLGMLLRCVVFVGAGWVFAIMRRGLGSGTYWGYIVVPTALAWCAVPLFREGFAAGAALAWAALLTGLCVTHAAEILRRGRENREHSGCIGEPNRLFSLLWDRLPFGWGDRPAVTGMCFEPLFMLGVAWVFSLFDDPRWREEFWSGRGLPAYLIPLTAAIGVFFEMFDVVVLHHGVQTRRMLDAEIEQENASQRHRAGSKPAPEDREIEGHAVSPYAGVVAWQDNAREDQG
ncbi:MAG: hypothetical protein ACIAQ0_08375 [Phycisphaerales bacterium JB058]